MSKAENSKYILCIETSTHVCSVAIGKNGNLVSLRETDNLKSHTAKITLFIQECLDEAGINVNDLDALAISKGPGSYTGLRIGASTAKGICHGCDIPLIALESTDILYRGVPECSNNNVLAAIDARRQEIYGKYFAIDKGAIGETTPMILDEEFSLIEQLSAAPFKVIGSGANKILEYFPNTASVVASHTSAAYMISPAFESFQSANFEDIVTYSPKYIKSANIILSNKKLL